MVIPAQLITIPGFKASSNLLESSLYKSMFIIVDELFSPISFLEIVFLEVTVNSKSFSRF